MHTTLLYCTLENGQDGKFYIVGSVPWWKGHVCEKKKRRLHTKVLVFLPWWRDDKSLRLLVFLSFLKTLIMLTSSNTLYSRAILSSLALDSPVTPACQHLSLTKWDALTTACFSLFSATRSGSFCSKSEGGREMQMKKKDKQEPTFQMSPFPFIFSSELGREIIFYDLSISSYCHNDPGWHLWGWGWRCQRSAIKPSGDSLHKKTVLFFFFFFWFF